MNSKTPRHNRKSLQALGTTLSLSMIVKNEEQFLEGCLESVKDIVDEIVVVDTGSTDATKEIASRFGAKVFDFEWVSDFSAARNYSLAQCTTDWILYLDADERLTGGQAELLKTLMSSRNAGAYTVLIKNPHSLHQGNFNQENVYPRLFRRLPGVKFEGKVHEQIWPSLRRHGISIRQSALVIQHLGYEQGYDTVREKAERNLELLQAQFASDPDDAYTQFQIGNTLVVLQRYEEAKPALERTLVNSRLDSSNRASCCNLLAEIEVKRGNLDEAVKLCITSLQHAPKQLMARWFLSLMYFDLSLYGKATERLLEIEKLLKIPSEQRSNQIASDLNLSGEDVAKRLATTYEAAGEYKQALAQYSRLVQLTDNKEGVAGLIRCAERIEDSRFVIEQLNASSTSSSHKADLFMPLAWHHRRMNSTRSAIELIDKSIDAQPENGNAYAFAVRWKMETGDIRSAERTLALAESKGIREFELHKAGLQLSLQKGDVNSAFHHLELMTQTTDADLTPIRNRLIVLREKVSASFSGS